MTAKKETVDVSHRIDMKTVGSKLTFAVPWKNASVAFIFLGGAFWLIPLLYSLNEGFAHDITSLLPYLAIGIFIVLIGIIPTRGQQRPRCDRQLTVAD